MIFLAIGLAAIVGGFVIAGLVKKARAKAFFSSTGYLSAHARMSAFFATTENVLERYEPIGRERVDGILRTVESSVSLFRGGKWGLPADDTKAYRRYLEFRKLATMHDAELVFLCVMRDYDEALKRNEYLPYSEYDRIIGSGRAAFDTVSNAGGSVLDETPDALARYGLAADDRDAHNRRFVASEMMRCKEFFDNCESYSLDEQQRTACVTDEDYGLIVAGAGSGKTSTILAKVRYLVEQRGVPASEILLISFTRKSAEDVASRLSKFIEGGDSLAQTFHKFGLEIVRKYGEDGRGVIDNPEMRLRKTVHSALGDGSPFTTDDYANIVKYFSYYFNPEPEQKAGESDGEFIERTRSMNFETMKSMVRAAGSHTTLSGEKVKSLDEVMVANFLFLNGVDYEYECAYQEASTRSAEEFRRDYKPDFKLTGYKGVYLEHFAIGEDGQPPGSWPQIEREKYLADMEWKRGLHRRNGTKCLESFSWWNGKGILFERLSEELTKAGVELSPRDPAEVWQSIVDKSSHQLSEFEKLGCTFITLFKSNAFGVSKFDEWKRDDTGSGNERERRRTFVSIVKPIYEHYESGLEEDKQIDFEDMINIASEIISSGRAGRLPYKYVIVDEYQDISAGRMRLLQALVRNTGAHLFCVGDDWQSIYRFSGSDINLFTNFEKYFPHHAELKIEHTYRNSQQLIDIMGAFVMTNKGQTVKRLVSPLRLDAPIVPVVFPEKNDAAVYTALGIALDDIASKEVDGRKVSVFLLGRTKYDRDCAFPRRAFGQDGLFEATGGNWYKVRKHPNVKVSFMTAHGSKGLEADYVILLNAKNDMMGFPNRIADDPLLQLVLTEPDGFEFAEERRLFYVALTRTRNNVYVLMPERRYSPFMDELFKLGVKDRIMLGGCECSDAHARCPKCRTGILVTRTGNGRIFSGCSNFPRCDYSVSEPVSSQTMRCPACGGFLLPRMNRSSGEVFYGCSNYPFCRHTHDPNAASRSGGWHSRGGRSYGGRSYKKRGRW